MKRLKFLISIILVLAFSVNAYAAAEIDGVDDGIEWQNSDYSVLIDKASVNNVDFAYVRTQVSSVYEVDYLIFLSDSLSGTYDSSGFILTVNDCLEIKVSSDGTSVDGDMTQYYVEAEMNVIDDYGATCEIRVGFRRGLPEKISAKACMIDGNGNHSYHYPVTVINPYNVEETEETIPIITKKSATKKPTEKKTEMPKETEKDIPEEKTSSKQKTTKKSADKTVVYFYEKEIIVSQVLVTESEMIEHGYTAENSEERPAVQSDAVRLSDGIKIQRAICFAGGALLIGLGVWASLSGKRKNPAVRTDSEHKEENTEEIKEENKDE